jgi:hypothetical protein
MGEGDKRSVGRKTHAITTTLETITLNNLSWAPSSLNALNRNLSTYELQYMISLFHERI